MKSIKFKIWLNEVMSQGGVQPEKEKPLLTAMPTYHGAGSSELPPTKKIKKTKNSLNDLPWI